HGCLTGTLAATPQGDDDRGFDRLLIPAGQTKPLALLPTAEWLKEAHRSRAARVIDRLDQQYFTSGNPALPWNEWLAAKFAQTA
ncbi:hypothetical protein NL501_29750, partial [Klebsiella pneumoniae]|nr:hypothetical protein [Klebsiella pneumoniae]